MAHEVLANLVRRNEIRDLGITPLERELISQIGFI